MISGPQYRKLMQHYEKTGNISQSARQAGVDRKTAGKYVRAGEGPGERKRARSWRTREDPFEAVWPQVAGWLESNPSLEATTAFEDLQRKHPGEFEEGQLRSLQRRFRAWKLENGPARKPVYFEQEHEPGRLLELDWFHPRDFEVRVAGERYRHLICHCVLTYSNWEWAIPCRSESFASLKSTLQGALRELGGSPRICQVDNSSTATHRLGKGARGRGFNERFLGLLAHYGMQPKTIQVGAANENGDVESSHGHLRRYLRDNLALRPEGSRFESFEEYERWLAECLRRRNLRRKKKLEQEKATLNALPPCRLPEYEETDCRVNKYSMARVGRGSYSVPTRYRGMRLRARIYESRIELWDGTEKVAAFERSANASGASVDWRHLIEDLCRKPGAFERYRYRQSFYPSPRWQRLGESLRERFSGPRADSDYLQILRLSLEHGQERIEELLERIDPREVSLDRIRAELGQQNLWRQVPSMDFQGDLSLYDQLLGNTEAFHG
jgi:transposase